MGLKIARKLSGYSWQLIFSQKRLFNKVLSKDLIIELEPWYVCRWIKRLFPWPWLAASKCGPKACWAGSWDKKWAGEDALIGCKSWKRAASGSVHQPSPVHLTSNRNLGINSDKNCTLRHTNIHIYAIHTSFTSINVKLRKLLRFALHMTVTLLN